MHEVTIPWPPSATSANKSKQGNWWEKSNAAKQYKSWCHTCCKEQKVPKIANEVTWFPITVTFHPPTNARLDPDNAVNRIKQGLDAVSEALGVDDSKFWQ